MGAKPPYPMESTTVTGNSTVLAIHLVKESLYIWLKYCTLCHPEIPSLTLLAIMLLTSSTCHIMVTCRH